MKYKLKYFKLNEFFGRFMAEKYSESILYGLMDDRILRLADYIRERFNKPMMINNWMNGGALEERGFRDFHSATGAMYSQHKFGRAIDFSISGMKPQEIYKDIVDNFNIYQGYGLTTVEDISCTPKWNHVDVRQTMSDKLNIVKG